MSSLQYPPGFSPAHLHSSGPLEEGEICSTVGVSSGKARLNLVDGLERGGGAENVVVKIPEFKPGPAGSPVVGENVGKVFSVFVDNIPEEANHKWLESTFGVFGMLADVYIPGHKSRRSNKRFGFVRFLRRDDADRAIFKLDGFWVGRSQLVVQEALYCKGRKKPSHAGGVGGSRNGHQVGVGINFTGCSSGQFQSRWTGAGSRSFAQVLSGSEQDRILNGKALERPKVIGMCSHMDWLDMCIIAKVAKVENLARIMELVRVSLDGIKQVRKWGGRKIVLEFSSIADRDAAWLSEEWKAEFVDIRQWDGEVVNRERLTQISCSHLPISAWNMTTFSEIAKLWGNLVDVEECTAMATELSSAKLLIETEKPWINEVIDVSLEDRVFEVSVSEISGIPVGGGVGEGLMGARFSRIDEDGSKLKGDSAHLVSEDGSAKVSFSAERGSRGQLAFAEEDNPFGVSGNFCNIEQSGRSCPHLEVDFLKCAVKSDLLTNENSLLQYGGTRDASCEAPTISVVQVRDVPLARDRDGTYNEQRSKEIVEDGRSLIESVDSDGKEVADVSSAGVSNCVVNATFGEVGREVDKGNLGVVIAKADSADYFEKDDLAFPAVHTPQVTSIGFSEDLVESDPILGNGVPIQKKSARERHSIDNVALIRNAEGEVSEDIFGLDDLILKIGAKKDVRFGEKLPIEDRGSSKPSPKMVNSCVLQNLVNKNSKNKTSLSKGGSIKAGFFLKSLNSSSKNSRPERKSEKLKQCKAAEYRTPSITEEIACTRDMGKVLGVSFNGVTDDRIRAVILQEHG